MSGRIRACEDGEISCDGGVKADMRRQWGNMSFESQHNRDRRPFQSGGNMYYQRAQDRVPFTSNRTFVVGKLGDPDQSQRFGQSSLPYGDFRRSLSVHSSSRDFCRSSGPRRSHSPHRSDNSRASSSRNDSNQRHKDCLNDRPIDPNRNTTCSHQSTFKSRWSPPSLQISQPLSEPPFKKTSEQYAPMKTESNIQAPNLEGQPQSTVHEQVQHSLKSKADGAMSSNNNYMTLADRVKQRQSHRSVDDTIRGWLKPRAKPRNTKTKSKAPVEESGCSEPATKMRKLSSDCKELVNQEQSKETTQRKPLVKKPGVVHKLSSGGKEPIQDAISKKKSKIERRMDRSGHSQPKTAKLSSDEVTMAHNEQSVKRMVNKPLVAKSKSDCSEPPVDVGKISNNRTVLAHHEQFKKRKKKFTEQPCCSDPPLKMRKPFSDRTILSHKDIVSNPLLIETPSVVSYDTAALLDATEASFDSKITTTATPIVSESPHSEMDKYEWSPLPVCLNTIKEHGKQFLSVPARPKDEVSDDGETSSDSDTDDEELWEWAEMMFGVTPPGLIKLRQQRKMDPDEAQGSSFYEKSGSKPTKLRDDGYAQTTQESREPIFIKLRKSKEQIEEKHRLALLESKRKKEEAKPLTAAQIRAILREEHDTAPSSHWVRRSSRQPSKAALSSPGVKALLEKLRGNDSDMVVLKMKKYINDPDAPHTVIDAALDALEDNSNCEALYIQNFNLGMLDQQVRHLLKILQLPTCKIWCLNIGETYNVRSSTWKKFARGLRRTKITHMYASEHTIDPELKDKIRETIRLNRKKHDMHINPNNLDVIVQCTHCWWNPMNAKVLQPYIRKKGYEQLLLDKEAQGLRGSTSGAPGGNGASEAG